MTDQPQTVTTQDVAMAKSPVMADLAAPIMRSRLVVRRPRPAHALVRA